MLTGLAIGTFKSLEEAASVMVKRKDTYYPDPEMHKKHMEMFEKFKMLYSALQPITEQ